MMEEMEILATGEIRVNDAYVGRVEWTAPMADTRGAGFWVRSDRYDRARADRLEGEVRDLRAKLAAARRAQAA